MPVAALTWIESNLIVLGLAAVLAGLALGVLFGGYGPRRARAGARRKAGSTSASPRRSPADGASGSSTTGASKARPRYPARS